MRWGASTLRRSSQEHPKRSNCGILVQKISCGSQVLLCHGGLPAKEPYSSTEDAVFDENNVFFFIRKYAGLEGSSLGEEPEGEGAK